MIYISLPLIPLFILHYDSHFPSPYPPFCIYYITIQLPSPYPSFCNYASWFMFLPFSILHNDSSASSYPYFHITSWLMPLALSPFFMFHHDLYMSLPIIPLLCYLMIRVPCSYSPYLWYIMIHVHVPYANLPFPITWFKIHMPWPYPLFILFYYSSSFPPIPPFMLPHDSCPLLLFPLFMIHHDSCTCTLY